MVAFVFGTYLWFVLLPMWFNYSFPTGGWDWLGFVGVVGGLFLSVWCLKKQQELSVVPCLDVDAYSTLDNNAQNKVFRIFNDTDGRIYNDGYIILRTPGKTEPDGFRKSANIKVTNKGLSTAFQVCVYLYDLKSVKGLASLDEIATTPIDDFYDKIDYKGYTYYEETGVDAEPVKNESGWLISPQYNLCANAGEFNLVFDFSKVTQKYHSTETLSMYAVYMSTLGNRSDLFPSSGYVDKYITNPPEDYEIPAEYLPDERFAALITEAEKYLGYPYVWGGSSPSTSFDCSGFVSYVLTNSGLCNTGRLGAQGLYNISTRVSDPQPGDLVFFVGTYDTAGISHVGFYVGLDDAGNPMFLHCGDPIQYARLNTSYWQQHFYAYGRPPYD